MKSRHERGFTLLKLLLAIGLIGAALWFIGRALNPPGGEQTQSAVDWTIDILEEPRTHGFDCVGTALRKVRVRVRTTQDYPVPAVVRFSSEAPGAGGSGAIGFNPREINADPDEDSEVSTMIQALAVHNVAIVITAQETVSDAQEDRETKSVRTSLYEVNPACP